MTESHTAIHSDIEDLIETCKDGQAGFLAASEAVEDPTLKELLAKFSLQRSGFAGELQSVAQHLGEHDPKDKGSVGGAIHRGWIHIKEAVTGKDSYHILAECESGEDVAVKAYKKALEHSLPRDVEEVVRKQFAQVQAAHDKVKALRDSAKK